MDLSRFRGLSTDVHAYIREQIMTGRLVDGHRIVERDIAAELGVSRGPIREALRLLEAEGLVITSPRRGTRVAAPKAENADDLFAIRAALEPVAATMLVERGGDDAIVALEGAILELERAVQARDWPQAIAADMHFHGLIFEHSGSRRLRRIWEEMHSSLVHIFRLHRPLYRSIDEVLPRHRAYLDVLRGGDAVEVRRHAAEHVNEFRDRFLEQIAAASAEAS
ncbi:MAG: GntR family transcriptional regulator [Candidatus Eremiobacteraeota bacterium]|nr:GntR family transcriptional regulator [Candidatus Eremiobacteraeota bacterium]